MCSFTLKNSEIGLDIHSNIVYYGIRKREGTRSRRKHDPQGRNDVGAKIGKGAAREREAATNYRSSEPLPPTTTDKLKGDTTMTNRQLDNRVKKLQDLEAQIKALEEQADAIRDEIKADLTEKGEDEHNTGAFLIRWKEIISKRLDSKALKAALPDVFATYSKESSSRRFTVTAA